MLDDSHNRPIMGEDRVETLVGCDAAHLDQGETINKLLESLLNMLSARTNKEKTIIGLVEENHAESSPWQ
jgi:hypothetical protein